MGSCMDQERPWERDEREHERKQARKQARKREQELIDLMFNFVMSLYPAGGAVKTRDDKVVTMDREQVGEWMRSNLRSCGFDTEQRGSSWAVLKR